MEKIKLIIVSDKEKEGLRDTLKTEIEGNSNLKVILLSRLKISRIRGEIIPRKPDLVFITVSLNNEEEFRELGGFIKKLRKHLARNNLPEAKIVIHTPGILHFQMKEFFEAGADTWVDEKLDYSRLGGILEAVMKHEATFHPLQVIKREEVG